MNQINENLLVLSPGDPYNPLYDNCLKIYLAGSLDVGGDKMTWQDKFINGLSKLTVPHPENPKIPDYSAFKFVVFNPLSPSQGEPSLENPAYTQKFQWCLQAQQVTDAIFCNFLKKSTRVSAIQDFLFWAQSGKLVARCPVECIYYPMVKLYSDGLGIPLLGDTGSVLQVMETIYTRIPKFTELKQYGL